MMLSSSGDSKGNVVKESRSGTDSIGTGGTGVTGVTGVKEVLVCRTDMLGCSGDPERTVINVSKCSCICRYCSASCFWPLKISFRISGWLSDKAASKLSWIGLTGDSQTMDCGDSAEICSAKSGTTALRWGGLAWDGLYRETTVVCKFEKSKF